MIKFKVVYEIEGKIWTFDGSCSQDVIDVLKSVITDQQIEGRKVTLIIL